MYGPGALGMMGNWFNETLEDLDGLKGLQEKGICSLLVKEKKKKLYKCIIYIDR